MKKILVILVMLCVSFTYAQEKKSVKYVDKGDLTEATYFYDNGAIQQVGTFNKEGQLHGIWTSYDLDGNKISVGEYENGKKVGKWLFWTGSTLKEVEFKDSKIVMVNQWNNKSRLAVK